MTQDLEEFIRKCVECEREIDDLREGLTQSIAHKADELQISRKEIRDMIKQVKESNEKQ